MPKRDRQKTIPIDVPCAVPGIERVYAAGDATDFAVKRRRRGSQAAIAAAAIAALAGAAVEPTSSIL